MVSGEPVLVKVIRVEPERRRIGLSVRQVRPDEWEEWTLTQIEEEQATTVEEGDEDEDDDLDFGDVAQDVSAEVDDSGDGDIEEESVDDAGGAELEE